MKIRNIFYRAFLMALMTVGLTPTSHGSDPSPNKRVSMEVAVLATKYVDSLLMTLSVSNSERPTPAGVCTRLNLLVPSQIVLKGLVKNLIEMIKKDPMIDDQPERGSTPRIRNLNAVNNTFTRLEHLEKQSQIILTEHCSQGESLPSSEQWSTLYNSYNEIGDSLHSVAENLAEQF